MPSLCIVVKRIQLVWQIYGEPSLRPQKNAIPSIRTLSLINLILDPLNWLRRLQGMNTAEPIESITLVGVCTDVCVVSNAILLKAGLPEVPIHVDPNCCAGLLRKAMKQHY